MKKNKEASRYWGFISYAENEPQQDILLPLNVKIACCSPLHSPDLSEEERKKMIEQATERAVEKASKAKKSEQREKIAADLEKEIESIESKELKQHRHFLMNFARRVRESTAEHIKELIMREDVELATRIERISDFDANFRYLFHFDNAEKQQFEISSCWNSNQSYFKYLCDSLLVDANLTDAEKREKSLWTLVSSIRDKQIQDFDGIYYAIFNKAACAEQLYEMLALARKNAGFLERNFYRRN